MVEQAEMRVLHDGVVAERCAAADQELYRLTLAVGQRSAVQVPVQPRRGRDAVGFLVEIDAGDHALPRMDRGFLFAKREQEILGQSPVEERADLTIYADD